MSPWRVLRDLVANLYFFLAPGNAKSLMDLHLPAVPPVLATVTYTTAPQGLPRLLDDIETAARDYNNIPYYANINACAVKTVIHLRQDTGVHEIVVLRVTRGEDERYVRFERFPQPALVETSGKALSPDVKATLGLLKTTGRVDSAMISDSLEGLTRGYSIVQQFEVSAQLLPVLDAIALANHLGECAISYSGLAHMCLWFAASLFRLLQLHVRLPDGESIEVHPGPSYDTGGTFRGIRLVDIRSGELVWSATNDKTHVLNAYEAVYRHGGGTEDLRAELTSAITQGESLSSVTVIHKSAAGAVARLHERIKTASDTIENLSNAAAAATIAKEEAATAKEWAARDRKLLEEEEARAAESDARAAESDARAAKSDARAAESDARAAKSDARAAELEARLAELEGEREAERLRYQREIALLSGTDKS